MKTYREYLEEAFRNESYHAIATGQSSHARTAIDATYKYLTDLRNAKTQEWKVAPSKGLSQEPLIAQNKLIDEMLDDLWALNVKEGTQK